MLAFTKFVNKNTNSEKDYNYIDVRLEYKAVIPCWYDLINWFYNIFYKNISDYDDRCTLIPPAYQLSDHDAKFLYPTENIKINDFDILISSLDTYYNHELENPKYESYINLLRKLFTKLLKFDENIMIYNVELINSNRNGPNSSIKSIGNDISQIKYIHEYDFCKDNVYGVNVIIKSKIIDLNLIYCLINNDMSYIAIHKNNYHFRLKDYRIIYDNGEKCKKFEVDIRPNVDTSSDKYSFDDSNIPVLKPKAEIDVLVEDDGTVESKNKYIEGLEKQISILQTTIESKDKYIEQLQDDTMIFSK